MAVCSNGHRIQCPQPHLALTASAFHPVGTETLRPLKLCFPLTKEPSSGSRTGLRTFPIERCQVLSTLISHGYRAPSMYPETEGQGVHHHTRHQIIHKEPKHTGSGGAYHSRAIKRSVLLTSAVCQLQVPAQDSMSGCPSPLTGSMGDHKTTGWDVPSSPAFPPSPCACRRHPKQALCPLASGHFGHFETQQQKTRAWEQVWLGTYWTAHLPARSRLL